MEKILKHKKILIFIIAIITTMCISVDVVYGSFKLDGNNFKWIVILGILYHILKYFKSIYLNILIFSYIIYLFFGMWCFEGDVIFWKDFSALLPIIYANATNGFLFFAYLPVGTVALRYLPLQDIWAVQNSF